MKKILKKTLTMMLILTLGMVKSSLATETKDMIPPEGNITITNSTITEGINYVDNLDVTLKISATDNVTTSANLKMYITTTPNANQIEILDEDWETYSTSKKITLPETKENIKIYAFFKDEAGNVSEIFTGENVKYNLIYDANGGKNTPASQESYFGMSIKVTEERPTYDGKYFLGWSTNKNSTVASYMQNSTITAESFKGANKDITLYAVWTSDVTKLPNLADMVEVGDYVNYPVSYKIDELVSDTNGAYKTGWRVYSKDVDLDGNYSKGTVNLISAGIPMMYNHTSALSSSVVTNLGKSFLKTEFSNTIAMKDNTYIQKGFIANGELIDIFTNKYTKFDSSNNPVVRALNLYDVANVAGLEITETKPDTGKITPKPTSDETNPIKPTPNVSKMSLENNTGISVNAIKTPTKGGTGEKITDKELVDFSGVPILSFEGDTKLIGEQYKGIYNIGIRYFLASRAAKTLVWGVGDDGVITAYPSKSVAGVRPILSLKTTTKTTGYDRHGIWELEAEDKVTVTLKGYTRKEIKVGGTYGNFETVTKKGHTFKGWYTKENGQGTKIEANTVVTETQNHTLYPYFEPISVTVTFDANGGTVGTSAKTVTYGEMYGELPTPTLTNMIFIGWYTTKTGGTRVVSTSKSQNIKDITLYAHWSTTSVDITLDPNGGTVEPEKITVSATGTYGTLPTPEKAGYSFTGWYTDKTGGTVVKASTSVDPANTTLYAHWAVRPDTKYTVYHMFENLAGDGYSIYKIEEKTGITEARIGLAAQKITITGGTYTKGTVEPNGEAITTTTILPDGSRTIYLYYTRKTYALTLTKGTNITAVTGAGSYKYGQEVTIDATVAATTSSYRYVFNKWTSNSSSLLPDQSAKQAIFEMPAGAITLVASATQEERISVTVNFDAQGGTVTPTQKQVKYGETYGELPTPTKAGYKFIRWYNGSYGTVTENTEVTNSKEHTLFAEWQEITYTITIKQPSRGRIYYNASDGWRVVNNAYVNEGETAQFNIDASTGYKIKSTIIDGTENYLDTPKSSLVFSIADVRKNYTISARIEEVCRCYGCDTGFTTDHTCSKTTCNECENCENHYDLCSKCGNCFIHCECNNSGGGSTGDDQEICSVCNGTGYSCGYYINSTPIKCSICGKKTLIKQGCSTHMWADSKCSGCGSSFKTGPSEQGCVTCGMCGGTGRH